MPAVEQRLGCISAALLLISLYFPATRCHELHKFNHSHPIPNISSPTYVRPRVLLFLHVPKNGGTTVRGLFHAYGWHCTYWSLTQRMEGFKANRILDAISAGLKGKRNKIFVEWHLGINWTVVPAIEHFTRLMRPDVNFQAWTILRRPLDFIASNGAFWRPTTPPQMYIRDNRDYFVHNVFELDRLWPYRYAWRQYVPSDSYTAHMRKAHLEPQVEETVAAGLTHPRVCGCAEPCQDRHEETYNMPNVNFCGAQPDLCAVYIDGFSAVWGATRSNANH